MATFCSERQSVAIQQKFRNVRVPYHVGITTDGARVCMCVRACMCFVSGEGGLLRALAVIFPVR
jgi:hypothetical protein